MLDGFFRGLRPELRTALVKRSIEQHIPREKFIGIARSLDPSIGILSVVPLVDSHVQPNLPQIAGAGDEAALFARLRQSRQKHRGHYGDNGDNHKQFNQRENLCMKGVFHLDSPYFVRKKCISNPL